MSQTNKTLKNVPFLKFLAIWVVAIFVILLSVPMVGAIIEVPPNDDIFFQTSGEQTPLNIGDAYSFNGAGGDDLHHLVEVNIPCLPNQIFRVELFDPEAYDAGAPAVDEIVDDEVRDGGDITTFILREPSGTEVASTVFGPHDPAGPVPATHDNWVAYATINLPANPIDGDTCGNYTIEVWTGDESGTATINNDDNAWKYRILGGPGGVGNETFDPDLGPDGLPATGDEAALGIQRLSFQHNTDAAQSFYWFVDDDAAPTWTGHNFDIDDQTGLCPTPDSCSINYIAPTLGVFPATLSSNAEWNPPGPPTTRTGDVFDGANVEPGLWSAEVTMPVNNQYIIEIENNGKPLFLEQPILPDVIINKDDGVTLVRSPGVTTYTIEITNTGPGAALPIPGPEVVDTLPPGMTFAACQINPPLEGTCAETAPGSGVVNFELVSQSNAVDSNGNPAGSILAYLPGTNSGLLNSGSLQVTANIDSGLSDGTLLTNTVQVDWTDILDNDYPPQEDDDTDIVQLNIPAVNVEKSTNGFDADDPNGDPVPRIDPGDTVTWEYVVTNIGDVPLENISLVDDELALLGISPTFVGGDTNGDGRLDLDETWLYQATGVAEDLANSNRPNTRCGPDGPEAPTYTNTATATGQFSQTMVTADDLSHYCNRQPSGQDDGGGNGGGDGGDDDDDDDDDDHATVTPAPVSMAATPAVQATPEPALPVVLLPETGLNGATEAGKNGVGIILLLMTLPWICVGLFLYIWQKVRKKDVPR